MWEITYAMLKKTSPALQFGGVETYVFLRIPSVILSTPVKKKQKTSLK